MPDCKTIDDERLLGTDPRDAAIDAEQALWGILDLMCESNRPLERSGVEALLRLVHDKLNPAVHCLQSFKPPV